MFAVGFVTAQNITPSVTAQDDIDDIVCCSDGPRLTGKRRRSTHHIGDVVGSVKFFVGHEDDVLACAAAEHETVKGSVDIEVEAAINARSFVARQYSNDSVTQHKSKQRMLETYCSMTADNYDDGPISDDKTPINPAPFSSHVDMSRLPSLSPQMSLESLANWSDLSDLVQVGKFKEAKQLIRTSDWSLGSLCRQDLWYRLCCHQSQEKEFNDMYYWDTVRQIYATTELSECHVGRPTFIDQHHLATGALSPLGVCVCERVLSVVQYSHPAITYAPALYSITAFLLHYMDEANAYNSISALVGGAQSRFLTQTRQTHESTWRAVQVLAKKFTKGSFSTLAKYGVPASQIDEAFEDWLSWILASLPLTHSMRVMDCFLFEGAKVLMRVALALFYLFVKVLPRDTHLTSSLQTIGFAKTMSQFCQSLQVPPHKLLKVAFGIRGFGKAEVGKALSQAEAISKSCQLLPAAGSSSKGCLSVEGLPSNESQANIQLLSHTLGLKELLTLWSWLPMRMTMHQPELVYTSEEHGCSLTTFFQRVEKHEPTLMLVRTTKDHVFGAYCSSAWSLRNSRDERGNRQAYFGTGETFLFALRPTLAKYPWVGIGRQRTENAVAVDHSAELFMHADADGFTVGGGNGHGIMLDQELRFGRTERCNTFDNEPLCPEVDFEVKVLEVYGLSV